MEDNTFAIQRIKIGETNSNSQIILLKIMEAGRKLDEFFFFNDNERKVKVSSIMWLYLEIVQKYPDLADIYRIPIKDKYIKIEEEFAYKLQQNQK